VGAGTAEPELVAVKIHDLDERLLAFDLPDVLDALGSRIAVFDWIAAD
jgi:hypothetical protein